MKRRHILSLALSTAAMTACRPLTKFNRRGTEDVLTIWWDHGYYAEQTDAITQIVNDWQQTSGHRARLLFINSKDRQSLMSAVSSGKGVPDVVYGHWLDDPITPLLARLGKLADLSAELQPLDDQLLPGIKAAVTYLDNTSGRRSIFAAPFARVVCNIHCWQDLIDASELRPNRIPDDWAGFWRFWRDVQTGLRKNDFPDVFAIGLPMSAQALDTFSIFESFMEAHGVQIVATNPRGDLLLNRGDNRGRLIAALEDYTNNYLKGYVPSNALNWSDASNNNVFISTLSAMTINPSLAIPGAMTADETNYSVRLKTLAWPKRLDGQILRPITTVGGIIAFRDSPRLAQARSFIAYFLQPHVTDVFIRGSQGRFVPVIQSLLYNDFWTTSSDPHIQMQRQTIQHSQPSPTVYHRAYSQVASQNVWGQMVNAVATGNLSAEPAADRAIRRIEAIFRAWS